MQEQLHKLLKALIVPVLQLASAMETRRKMTTYFNHFSILILLLLQILQCQATERDCKI